eukprot:CAMPEP_0113388852 /NCGR_PEP_ID=MMETSP0013_2-20120614/9305_1 /TAXON_ID=2843 ORGANISM="Skeletonema costatum, Strain 1716" /NCGR_SAMPLE_ID=MMETSP0013_2 /ASSEMBLY_ACC=CAM_ASM_000158 /LENGTH=511 /DNA_ID=CAMNT_0000271871 /DNA_START=97 /DNA_END=1632 /DNA_ORIENTATION=+ /assembly_acc=CAM_ASM_000158
MIIRVRTNIGIWRVTITSPPSSITTQTILDTIAQTRPHVVYEAPLSLDPKCSEPIDTSRPLCEQHGVQMRDGLMIYCKVDSSTCAENTVGNNNGGNTNDTNMSTTAAASEPSSSTITKRIIAKDGTIKLIHTTDTDPSNNKSELGFRKGLMPLRDIKKSWTLNEFTAMDDKYNFKIKRQESSFVGVEGLHLESGAVESFQNYLRRFQFRQQRFGYLYGRFVEEEEDVKEEEEEDRSHLRQGWGARMPQKNESKVKKNKKVIVEAIYEPPQEADADAAEGFVMLEDDQEENVEQVASLLGLRKVGWIVGQPPRETGFQFSAAEVIMAAELQLECAQGVEETPFVTVRCTVGDEGNVIVEAFQVSLQCMEMVAEEALDIGPNPGFCYVNETFTAIQEGKPSPTVENNFFLTLVPIHGYQSDMFVTQFPFVNRPFDDRQQTHDEMKRQLTKSGQAGWTFIDLLSDFALLLYLCKFLDVSQDMPKICESVKDREVLLDDGYKIIISSMAGMDGSY